MTHTPWKLLATKYSILSLCVLSRPFIQTGWFASVEKDVYLSSSYINLAIAKAEFLPV